VTLLTFQPQDEQDWDAFIAKSAQGTFLQTRRFLSYHGDRFEDCSLLFKDDKERIRAVLPAARSLSDPETVVSHPGTTYGALLHDPRCRPDEIARYVAALVRPYPLPMIMIKDVKYEIEVGHVIRREYFCDTGRVVNVDDEGVWIKCKESLLLVKKLREAPGHTVHADEVLKLGQRI